MQITQINILINTVYTYKTKISESSQLVQISSLCINAIQANYRNKQCINVHYKPLIEIINALVCIIN